MHDDVTLFQAIYLPKYFSKAIKGKQLSIQIRKKGRWCYGNINLIETRTWVKQNKKNYINYTVLC